ncbi:uncharacterized protein AMSG_12101 [Thecamonas trahens ATCC 50062]|uniref:Uncharacterized protein n=1 Tax=Thecamonas trahens ATCC 50062 TaxID=461836 RepID=A0A0L0DHV7_THETB|nr:hypothetical protein AMSG_12101 [Thecamonas trahens ATCC 50062]KNC51686.1 hypothetical protein AMSG_12101 [Thecamonas trahens ATCC 50062]|eukprot:XP_013755902.1 hypothetical protein AMSG_12101 [Thecamonas trahens ATCC 50062]
MTESTWSSLEMCFRIKDFTNCGATCGFNAHRAYELHVKASYNDDPTRCPIQVIPGVTLACPKAQAYSSVCTATANMGYEIIGDTSTTCGADGSWSPSISASKLSPYCPVPATTAAYSTSSCTGELDTSCTITCNSGYGSPANANSGTCLASTSSAGQWTNDPWNPACYKIHDWCPALPSVADGVISCTTPASRRIGDICALTCNTGYAPAGSSTRQCSGSRAWSGSSHFACASTPNFCSPITGANSSPTQSCNGYINEVCSFACVDGYQDTESYTCQSNTNWSPSNTGSCTIVNGYCPALAVPSNGNAISYSNPNRVINTVATLGCNNGYTPTGGDATRVCQVGGVGVGQGLWETPLSACGRVNNYCTVFTVANAVVSGGCGRRVADSCSYTCNPGYVDASTGSATCSPSTASFGVWSPTSVCDTVANYCPAAPAVANGVVSSPNREIGDSATLTCNFGYQPVGGVSTQLCSEGGATAGTGTWAPTLACERKPDYCDTLSVSKAAVNTPCGRLVGDSCTYSCNVGYEDTSTGSTTCSIVDATSGAWSPTPGCVITAGYCPVLAAPPSGTISYGSTRHYMDVVTLTCNTGYIPTAAHTQRTCQANQAWSGNAFSCSPQPNYCSALSVGNGVPDGGCVREITQSCSYSCNAGYQAANAGSTTCTVGPAWSPPTQCSTFSGYCPSLATPTNAIGISYASGRELGDLATLSCTDGYEPSAGQSTRTCGPGGAGVGDGTWSDLPFACVRKPDYCVPLSVANGVETPGCGHKIDDVCAVTCSSGYEDSSASGPDYTCQAASQLSGAWSGSPLCTKISGYCLVIPPPAFAIGIGYGNNRELGDTATLTCNNGYVPQGGNSVQTCGASSPSNGAWSGPAFACIRKINYCADLAGANGMPVPGCMRRIGDTCLFDCGHGFMDVGHAASGYNCTALSAANGVWDGAPACLLIPNYCAPQAIVPDGSVNCTTAFLGDTCELTCNTGYQAVGGSQRTCLAAAEWFGTWSGDALDCEKIPDYCTLPAGAYGSPAGTCGQELGNGCYYTCDAGYRSQVLVNATRTCSVGSQGSGGGAWVPPFPDPLCVPLPCRNLPLLGNGTLVPQYGAVTLDTVDATCNEGYTLVGETVLACEADPLDTIWSAWSAPVPYCEPNNCTASEVPVDGYVVPSLVISTDAWVSYGCDPGFELWGNTARRCLPSGELSGTLPSCEPVLCPTNFTAPGNGSMVPGSGGAVTRDSVTFACNTGYFFVGQTVRTCEQGNATVPNAWSHSDYLKCIGQPCYPKLEDPINGKVSTHFGEFQDIARYECNAGYELNGNVTRMCASWGNWTVTPPVCDPLPCPTVIQPLNQDMLYFDSDESKTVLDGMTTDLHHVMCKAGFVFSPGVHELSMQCLPAPNNPAYPLAVDWFPQLPTCIPLPCPPLSAPANGQVSAAGGVTRDTVTYACDPGYYIAERGDQMVYQMTVTCLPDTRALSRWSEPQPRCVKMPNYCPSVGPADNGQISLSVPSPSLEWGKDEWITASACTETLGDGCGKFVCNAGFQRVGPATIECTVGAQQVGLWSPELPSAAEWCEPCPEGTYKSFSARDVAEWQCIPCPLGGYCAGGGSIPIAAPGWWQNPDTGGFLTCVPMTNCLQGACRGGHRGFKCELCENGWYKKDGTNCVVCPPAKQVVYPILIVLAICLCVLLVKLARKSTHYFASLAVGASFLQMISILPSFGIEWPSFVKSFFNVFQILALNLSQFFEPQCMVDQGSSPFLLVWAIKMSLPLIFSAIFLFGGGLASAYYLIRKCVPTRKLEQCSPRLAGWFPELSKLGLKVVLWSCLNAFLTCLVLCYIVLTSAALSIFGCTRQADGTLTMNAEPAMTCKSKTWNNMVAVSVVALLLYGVGFPATVFWVLRTRRYSLWKEKNVIRYGLLYQRYLRKFYLYELVLIVRKFLFVFGKALFPGSPQAQIIWAMCTVLLGSGVQYMFAPFRDWHINWLEQLHLVSAAFILMLGVVFDSTASSMSESGRTTLGIIIICIIVINIVVMGVAVGMALRVQYKLMRHGVSGGYASDELRVMPIFFKFDMRIVERQRRVTPHSILWTLELTTKRPLPLATTLLRDSIALGATVEEVLHNVEGEPERYARVEQSEDLMTTYAWYLIPCRGVYSARLLVDGERVSELVARGTYTEDEQAALEQALSSENAELAKNDVLVASGDTIYTVNVCGPLHTSPCAQQAPNTAVCQSWAGGCKPLGSARELVVAPLAQGQGVRFTASGGAHSTTCGSDWQSVIELTCDEAASGTPVLKLLGLAKCVATFVGASAVACPIAPPKPPVIPETYSFSFARLAGNNQVSATTYVGAANVDMTRGLQRIDSTSMIGETQVAYRSMSSQPYVEHMLQLTSSPKNSDPTCTKTALPTVTYIINPTYFDKATLEAEELFRGIKAYQWKLATSNTTYVSYAYVSSSLDPYLIGTQTLDVKKGVIVSEMHIFDFTSELPPNPALFDPPPMCTKHTGARIGFH